MDISRVDLNLLVALRELLRGLAGQGRLIDIHRQNLMRHAQLLQQFAAARRSRGEYYGCEVESSHSR